MPVLSKPGSLCCISLHQYLVTFFFCYFLPPHPRVVVLESRPTDHPTAQSNLYILAGHENSYWVQSPALPGGGETSICFQLGREWRRTARCSPSLLLLSCLFAAVGSRSLSGEEMGLWEQITVRICAIKPDVSLSVESLLHSISLIFPFGSERGLQGDRGDGRDRALCSWRQLLVKKQTSCHCVVSQIWWLHAKPLRCSNLRRIITKKHSSNGNKKEYIHHITHTTHSVYIYVHILVQ